MVEQSRNRVSTEISPDDSMQLLSRREVEALYHASHGERYELFRLCALAVMNSGSSEDDTNRVLAEYEDFAIKVIQRSRGIKLELSNAPGNAFVDGVMIQGIKEHLFSVLRDVVYITTEVYADSHYNFSAPGSTTEAVFNILRNAGSLISGERPRLVVCWGGHSIGRLEYDYTKLVGYELGLRGLDVCTGCGPGAMKGPMKGATIGHAEQRLRTGRYLGITEPGIIAAESPNPIVNDLVILPDIEKRLEAFVRLGHGIIVFPGGVGTAEEILYILGILLHPDNADISVPLVFTAPESSSAYFHKIDKFIELTLGDAARARYQIIIADQQAVASAIRKGMDSVKTQRQASKDAYYFNWSLVIPPEFQQPFIPTHANMAALNLQRGQAPWELAANLRRVFSGLVAGNVKAEGLRAVAEYGKYQINGEPEFMQALDSLLLSFAQQGRMKINAEQYSPCYEVVIE